MIRDLIRAAAAVTIAVCEAALEATTEGDRPEQFGGYYLPPIPDNRPILPARQSVGREITS